MNKIILYYKYVKINNPKNMMEKQRALCENLNLKGRIIIAKEGINGTLEGTEENIQKYVKYMQNYPAFKGIHIKYSDGTDNLSAFPKLSVKVKPEIVNLNLGDEDIDPNKTTGKHINADELHELFESGQEFYIIDMRNDYEHKVGHFKNSVLPGLKNFRDLPKVLKDLKHLKDKKIVTVCTGGVRCEKASGYLLTKGFKDVSQLYGGMHTYMEKYPNTNFLGDLYVFDNRVVMAFNTDSPDYTIIGKCEHCGKTSNNYINCSIPECHKHFICCEDCLDGKETTLCDKDHSYLTVKQAARS